MYGSGKWQEVGARVSNGELLSDGMAGSVDLLLTYLDLVHSLVSFDDVENHSCLHFLCVGRTSDLSTKVNDDDDRKEVANVTVFQGFTALTTHPHNATRQICTCQAMGNRCYEKIEFRVHISELDPCRDCNYRK